MSFSGLRIPVLQEYNRKTLEAVQKLDDDLFKDMIESGELEGFIGSREGMLPVQFLDEVWIPMANGTNPLYVDQIEELLMRCHPKDLLISHLVKYSLPRPDCTEESMRILTFLLENESLNDLQFPPPLVDSAVEKYGAFGSRPKIAFERLFLAFVKVIGSDDIDLASLQSVFTPFICGEISKIKMQLLPEPIDFKKWIQENEEFLQPPVNNRCMFLGKDFIVMVVGGPNKRTDFHINETEEWFYQVKGGMTLRIAHHEDKVGHTGPVQFQDITIGEGQMFLLPGNTPHAPIRSADTLGLVIERIRTEVNVDRLRWYCGQCSELVYEDRFFCADIVDQLKHIMEAYAADAGLRTCKHCGHLNPTK